jgi:YegS/Rv2252/BmrU family lipid kinase
LKVLVIGNPTAGAGRADRRAAELVRALERRGHAVEWLATRAAGDARRAAAECEGAVECIVVAGGDGTLNEVLNGLADPGATPLVPMPLGTANMLARALGLPGDPARIVETIEHGSLARIDLGLASGGVGDSVRFLSVAGVGFDAAVTRAVARSRRGRLGYRGYVAPILRTLLRDRPPRLTVRLDGSAPLRAGLVIVCKLPNYGGVLRVAPEARPDDGRLHASVFAGAGRIDLLRAVVPAFRGRLEALSGLVVRAAQRIEVDAEEPAPVQLDGDYLGTTPVVLTLAPGRVPIRVPATPGRDATASG